MSCCCSKKSENELRICGAGAEYVKKQREGAPKIAILCCEGGCAKGEIARVAANKTAYLFEKNNSVRVCLGEAATGDSGFIELLKSAPKVVAVEGCFLKCGTEIIRKRFPEFNPDILIASDYYKPKSDYFEIYDIPTDELEQHSNSIVTEIRKAFFLNESV